MKLAGITVFIISLFLRPDAGIAQLNRQQPKNLENVGIDERLGEVIPLDLTFATSAGDSVTLADLFKNDKPVLLNPVYYECPMLCTLVIDAVFEGIKDLKWSTGKEYNIVTFSFDPEEDHELAATVKDSITQRLGRKDAGSGWYFLTGTQKNIEQLTKAIGYKYHKIDRNGQYAHTASIQFLSPEGVLTRYLYGLKFDSFNIKNALYDAADGNIGSTVDQILLYCYQFDPDSNSYVPVAIRIMKLGGLITMLALGTFIGLLWLKGKTFNTNKNTT